eukprot:3933169-Rhodomonas_salina.1
MEVRHGSDLSFKTGFRGAHLGLFQLTEGRMRYTRPKMSPMRLFTSLWGYPGTRVARCPIQCRSRRHRCQPGRVPRVPGYRYRNPDTNPAWYKFESSSRWCGAVASTEKEFLLLLSFHSSATEDSTSRALATASEAGTVTVTVTCHSQGHWVTVTLSKAEPLAAPSAATVTRDPGPPAAGDSEAPLSGWHRLTVTIGRRRGRRVTGRTQLWTLPARGTSLTQSNLKPEAHWQLGVCHWQWTSARTRPPGVLRLSCRDGH